MSNGNSVNIVIPCCVLSPKNLLVAVKRPVVNPSLNLFKRGNKESFTSPLPFLLGVILKVGI